MADSLIFELTGIIVLGLLAQWIAWRISLPAILLLLLFGVIAGPISGWLHPDAVFGGLLEPIVSLSVALILYEGGLTLKLTELPKVGRSVLSLVTVGAAITWAITAMAAIWLLQVQLSTGILIGALLIVTGPTVVTPLLRHIRPTGVVGPLLRWEGIIIDPIGALATVLVFEAIVAHQGTSVAVPVAVLKTIFIGGGLGLLAAGVLALSLRRFWIPDFLQNPISLMLVVGVFTASNALQHESGLFAVTVMGFAVANQKWVNVEHIIEFKETLGVLLISFLFVVLAARLDLDGLAALAWQGSLFVLVLILVARPLCVLVATFGASLTLRQKCFLSWMAPRGIVAAAIASVFALRLEAAGHADAQVLVSTTFMAIIGTVAVYGLTSPFVARKLGVAESDPQGILFVGAQSWVRAIALAIQREGFAVQLVDTNWDDVQTARMAGLPTYAGSILAEHTEDAVELGGIGRLVAVTPNDWVNVLAVQRLGRTFGKAGCFQIPPRQTEKQRQGHRHLHGRWLFGEGISHAKLDRKMALGYTVKVNRLSEKFDYDAFRARYGEAAVALFVISEQRRLNVLTSEEPYAPKVGDTLISLVKEVE